MKKLFAILLCACLLLGLAACDTLIEKPVEYAASNTAQYNAILTEATIVHVSPIFGTNTASYACVDKDGYVYCEDYVYKNDVVTSWAETMYIPTAGATDEQLDQLDQQVRANLMDLESEDCCTVTYKQLSGYYVVTCVFKDMDKPENYKVAFEREITDQNSAISMKNTEDGLLAEGYVKK